MTLVTFTCPACGRTLDAPTTATVAHYCPKVADPRKRLTVFTKQEDPK